MKYAKPHDSQGGRWIAAVLWGASLVTLLASQSVVFAIN